jgi:uncharacterized membrane protein
MVRETAPRAPVSTLVPLLLAAATVLLQIAYPLVDGHPRDVLTVVTVVAFFTASATHAAVTRGAVWTALMVAVTAGGGLLAESVGTRTGLPFGDYSYADTLGWQLLGVPVVIPLAWSMMAYPCLLAGQALARSPWLAALVGGAMLAGWDLFLDPQMVEAGHWSWADPTPALPGVPGIPISNFAGWLVVAVVLMAALQLLPRRTADTHADTRGDERAPTLLLAWTYLSSVLANAVFFGRPGVALVGGIGMGVTVVPWLRRLTQ